MTLRSLIASAAPAARAGLAAAPRAAGLAVTLFAAAVLVGWLFGVETLKSIRPGYVVMNPVSAVAFAMAGASLLLHGRRPFSRRVVLCLASAVALIGAAKLAELLAGREVGVDQWLFTSELHGNRMAPNTALNFLLCGLALPYWRADPGGRSSGLPSRYWPLGRRLSRRSPSSAIGRAWPCCTA